MALFYILSCYSQFKISPVMVTGHENVSEKLSCFSWRYNYCILAGENLNFFLLQMAKIFNEKQIITKMEIIYIWNIWH